MGEARFDSIKIAWPPLESRLLLTRRFVLLVYWNFVASFRRREPFFRRISTFTNSIRFVISFYLKEEAYNIGANSAGPSRRYFERRKKEEEENPPRNISSSPRSGISRKSTICFIKRKLKNIRREAGLTSRRRRLF